LIERGRDPSRFDFPVSPYADAIWSAK